MANRKVGDIITDNYDRYSGAQFNTKISGSTPNGMLITDDMVDNSVIFKDKSTNGGGYSIRSEFLDDLKVNVKWFGAKGDGINNESDAFRLASRLGFDIKVPKGEYLIDDSLTLSLLNQKIEGDSSVIFKNGTNISPIVRMASNSEIEGLVLSADNATSTIEGSVIEVVDGENFTIKHSKIISSIKGIHANPSLNGSIKSLKIIGNAIDECRWGLFIGRNTSTSTGTEKIEDVIIMGNTLNSGKNFLTGGDGIKLQKKTFNVVIVSNIIKGYTRDGIDLFASGDRVIIDDNVISGNLVKGIDIKSDTTAYTEDIWGFNGRFINILGNTIEDNLGGIGISMNRDFGDYNYAININNNFFIRNRQNAINIDCKYFMINNNQFFFNSQSTDTSYHTISVGDDLMNDYGEYGNILSNIFVNNGNPINFPWAIRVGAYCKSITVESNIISNDESLENPNQNRGIYVNDFTDNITVRSNNIDDSVATQYRLPTDQSTITSYVEPKKYTILSTSNLNLTNKYDFEFVEGLIDSNKAVVNALSSVKVGGVKVFKNSSNFSMFVDCAAITIDGSSDRITLNPGDHIQILATSPSEYRVMSQRTRLASVDLEGVVKQSVAVGDVTSNDAFDLPTVIDLANEIKGRLNQKFSSDRQSGQQAQ